MATFPSVLQGDSSTYRHFDTIDAKRYLLRGSPFPPNAVSESEAIAGLDPKLLFAVSSSLVGNVPTNSAINYIPAPGNGQLGDLVTRYATEVLTSPPTSEDILLNIPYTGRVDDTLVYGNLGQPAAWINTHDVPYWCRFELIFAANANFAGLGASKENFGVAIQVNGVTVAGMNMVLNGTLFFRDRAACYAEIYVEPNEEVTFLLASGFNADELLIDRIQITGVRLGGGVIDGVTG